MPHRRRPSSPRRRRGWPSLALLGLLAGCGPSAPADDAADSPVATPSPSAAGAPAGDPRLRALADSAARLDSAFRLLRDSLDAERRALDSVDRRTPEYARRWDAFVARERDAAALRARRDSLRARASGGASAGRPARPRP